jgi:hypothetical protein
MWTPCFIGGDTPKGTLDKIESIVASVLMADRGACKFIQQWGRHAHVAAGNIGAEVNQPSVSTALRDFPQGTNCNAWAK